MKKTDTEETFFREIMSKSKLSVPFSDFEDNVMILIDKKLSKKSSISRDFKLSWIFFIVGTTFGTILSIILPKLQMSVLGIPLDKLTIPYLTVFSFLLVIQLDNLINFYKRQNSTKRPFTR
jgi:hypothetical protein